MQIFYSIEELPELKNSVISTGSFDGVHLGHQKILGRIRNLARNFGGPSVVVTFDPHPREVIYPKDNTLRLLNSTREKLDLLEQQGIDIVLVLPFTVEFSQMQAREYVQNFLIRVFQPACVVVGYDHRFGLNREGTCALLRAYEAAGHFQVEEIAKQEVDDITVSSSKVRAAVDSGQIEIANALCGHPYTLSGMVRRGDQIGSTIGFPTANIEVDHPRKLLPPGGIYAGYALMTGQRYRCMVYLGRRPTLQGENQFRVECNILNFNKDIYGKYLRVELVKFVRQDLQLADLNSLKEALEHDKLNIIDILEEADQKRAAQTAIAILNYNGANILPGYLPSVLKHSANHDVVIIDNKSTDNSIEVIRNIDKTVRIIALDENYGFAGGYNEGLKALDHDYCLLLNSDVRPDMNWLPPLIEAMEQNRHLAACQPKIRSDEHPDYFEYAGAAGGFIDFLGYPFCAGRIFDTIEPDRNQYDQCASLFWVSGAAMLVRRELFESFGGFDDTYFAHMEEIELCWRWKRAGYELRMIPESVVYHLGGGTLPYASARKTLLNFRNNLWTILKHARASQLWLILPLRLVLDIAAMLKFIFSGKVKSGTAVIQSYWQTLMQLGRIRKSRSKFNELIEELSVGKSTVPQGRYGGSIVFDYYVLGKRKYSEIVRE